MSDDKSQTKIDRARHLSGQGYNAAGEWIGGGTSRVQGFDITNQGEEDGTRQLDSGSIRVCGSVVWAGPDEQPRPRTV